MNALNSILSYIQRPGSIKTLESLGIKMFADEARTQFRNVMEIFKDVQAKWNTASDQIKDGFVKSADDAGLFSEELATALGMQEEWNDLQQRDIAQASAGVYRRNYYIGMIKRLSEAQEVLNNMTDAAGYSQAENTRTMDTLEKKVQSLKTAANELAVALGDAGLLNILKDLATSASNAADAFSDAEPELKAFVTTALEIIGLSAGLKGVMGLFTTKNLIFGAGALLPGWSKLLVLIPALIGGIALYTSNLSKAATGTAELRRQQDSLTDTYDSQMKAADDTNKSTLEEARAAETLANRLEELTKRENLNVSEKAQMKAIVDQLNGTLPNLNLKIDEQTGKIDGNTAAIRDNIRALKDQAIAQAYQSKASAAGTAYVNQEILLGETQNELTIAESELSALKTKYGPALKEIEELRKAAKEQGLPMEGLGRAIAKVNEAYGTVNIESQVSTAEKKIKGLTDLAKEQADQLSTYSAELDAFTTKTLENAPKGSGGSTTGGGTTGEEDLVILYKGEDVKYVKPSEVAKYLKQGWSRTYTSTGGGGGTYSNPALDNALKALAHKKALNQISYEDEIAYLNKIKGLYVKKTDELWDIEERIYNAEKELKDKRLQDSVDWINEQKELGKLSTEEEIAAWERVKTKQSDNIEAVKEAELNLYKLRTQLAEETTEKEENSIEHWGKLGVYTIQQQIDKYRELYDVKVDSIEEEREQTEKLFGLYKDLFDEQQKAIKDAYDERIKQIENEADKQEEAQDAIIKGIEEQEKALERAETEKSHADKMKDIEEDIAYWSVRTSEEARQKILELQKDKAEEEHDYEVKQQKQSLDDQKQAAEDEKDRIKKDAEEKKAVLENMWDDVQDLFSDNNLNLIANAATTSKAVAGEYQKMIDKMREAMQTGEIIRNKEGGLEIEGGEEILGNANKFVSKTKSETEATNAKIKSLAQKILEMKYRYDVKKDYSAAADAEQFYHQLESLGARGKEVAAQLTLQDYAEAKKYVPELHTGGETLSYGMAYVKPGEVWFPPTLSTDLKTLIAVAAGISGKVSGGGNSQQIDNRKNVKIDKALNIEHYHAEDSTDFTILSRELKRELASLT